MDLCSINDSAAYIDRPIANFEHDKSQNTHISDMVTLAAFISNSQTPMPSLNKSVTFYPITPISCSYLPKR